MEMLRFLCTAACTVHRAHACRSPPFRVAACTCCTTDGPQRYPHSRHLWLALLRGKVRVAGGMELAKPSARHEGRV